MSGKKKVIFLGHGVGVKFCIEEMLRTDRYMTIGIITHPKEDHQADLNMIAVRKEIYGEHAYNIFNAPDDFGSDLLESADVNSENTINWIKEKNPDYLVSIGCRSIIRKDFLQVFKNKVLNLHTTPLPKYRGGASDSWMILNGLSGTTQYGCSHFIDSGIDSGNIIARQDYTIPIDSYPIDVYKTRMGIIGPLLIKTLDKLKEPGFKGEQQNSDEMSVFPRLYTPRDGKIDFARFSGLEIERFVRAFGYPFSGAFCYLGEQRLSLMKVSFHDDQKFHSFCNGLIFGRDNKRHYKIVTKSGYLIVHKIEIEGMELPQAKIFRLGKYLT